MNQENLQSYGSLLWAAMQGREPDQHAAYASPTDKLIEDAVQILIDACHGAAIRAGWWHDLETGQSLIGHRNVPEMLMLIVSETAEAMEAFRKSLPDDKLADRPGIEVELADAIIRIMDLGGALGLDLPGAVVAKMAFNRSRADHKPEARRAVGGKSF